jgi:hypothetical protein
MDGKRRKKKNMAADNLMQFLVECSGTKESL